MKRLALLLPLLLVVVGLSACGDSDQAVATVNGEEAMTVDQMDELLDQVGDADDLLAAQSARGSGRGTVRSDWVSSEVMYYVVQSELLRQDLAEQGIEVDDDAFAAGEVILTVNLANPQVDGRQPVTIDQLPSDLQDLYRTYFARYSALAGSLGADLQEIIDFDIDSPNSAQLSAETGAALDELGNRIGELRVGADVEIEPAWGRWIDTENGPMVAPPEGPVASPTATTELAPAG